MKDRPIIFSAEMVLAILEGRKRQTRRPLKKQPLDILPMRMATVMPQGAMSRVEFSQAPNSWVGLMTREPNSGIVFKCKYGEPGDRLWVRETWMPVDLSFREPTGYVWRNDAKGKLHAIVYRASTNYRCDWNSPIHMPRWASRITLEITGASVKRLQTINSADCLAEGIQDWLPGDRGIGSVKKSNAQMVTCFAVAWDALNSKQGFSWESNPYVWRIEFRRLGNDKTV